MGNVVFLELKPFILDKLSPEYVKDIFVLFYRDIYWRYHANQLTPSHFVAQEIINNSPHGPSSQSGQSQLKQLLAAK